MRIWIILIIALVSVSCKNQIKNGRYISETDTSFSKDIRDISAKINKDPNNPELFYNRGNAFFYAEKFKDASLDFTTAVELAPQNPIYHNILGETMLKLDTADSKVAMEHFDKAIALKSDFNPAKLNKARLLLARQQYDRAMMFLSELITSSEYSDRAYVLLGICAKEKKDTALAIDYYEKALGRNPDNMDAALQIADLYMLQNNHLALKYYDKVLAKEELNYEALYGKGYYYQKNNQMQIALKLYDRVREIRPEHKLAVYNSAFIYTADGNYLKGIDYCEKVLEMDSKNANALALKGYCNEKIGNKKAALEDYQAALAIQPNHVLAKLGIEKLGL